MQTPPSPSQKQAAEAQQARFAAERAILNLFRSVEVGEGSGENDESSLHAFKIIDILSHLSAAIVYTSFRSPNDRSKSLLLAKPAHDDIAEGLLEDAQRAFNRLLSADLTAEQRAVLWATWAYSQTAEEISEAINSGRIPHAFTEQGLGVNKVWISRSDARVRKLHATLHGKTIPTGDDFHRWPHTGQRLRWPGDEDAPADATIGCRCVCLLSWASQSSVSETIRKITERTRKS